MNIKITGYSGYLGTQISNELKIQGHEVFGIQRKYIYGSLSMLAEQIEGADIIISLSGAPIFQRWNSRTKKLIFESRVRTNRNLVSAIRELPPEKRPKKFISASAIGIYKTGFEHDEDSTNFDTGFLGEVVKNWESACDELPENIQKIFLRIGIVLGKEAKSIKNLILPTQLGLGATIGNGKQAFPFIHEKDVLGAFLFAILKYDQNQVFNLVAPEKINNQRFTQTFAQKLKRKAFFSIPVFVLKAFLGESSVLLTEGAYVYPKNLLDAGFEFKFPTIDKALDEILS